MQRHTVVKLWFLGFLILPTISGIVGARYYKVAVDKVRAHFNPPRLTVEALLKSNRLPLPILPVPDTSPQYEPLVLDGHAFTMAKQTQAPDAQPEEALESSMVRRIVKVRHIAAHVKEKARHVAELNRRPYARQKKLQHTNTAAFWHG